MRQVVGMSKICTIGAMKVYMRPPTASHQAPYYKVRVGGSRPEKEASIGLDGTVYRNSGFTDLELKTLLEWAALNKEGLKSNWKKVCKGEKPEVLPPPPSKKKNKIHSGLELINMIKVEPTDNWEIIGTFDNGVKLIIDMKPFLDWSNWTAPLKDIKYFKKVRVIDGAPTWPNELDFDPADLYELGEPVKKPLKQLA